MSDEVKMALEALGFANTKYMLALRNVTRRMEVWLWTQPRTRREEKAYRALQRAQRHCVVAREWQAYCGQAYKAAVLTHGAGV